MSINLNRGGSAGNVDFSELLTPAELNDKRIKEMESWITDEVNVSLKAMAQSYAERLGMEVPGLPGKYFGQMFEDQQVFDYMFKKSPGGATVKRSLKGVQGEFNHSCKYYERDDFQYFLERRPIIGKTAMNCTPSRYPIAVFSPVFTIRVAPNDPTITTRYFITKVYCCLFFSQWSQNWDLLRTSGASVV